MHVLLLQVLLNTLCTYCIIKSSKFPMVVFHHQRFEIHNLTLSFPIPHQDMLNSTPLPTIYHRRRQGTWPGSGEVVGGWGGGVSGGWGGDCLGSCVCLESSHAGEDLA